MMFIPLNNAGLELTGPWHPLDMAFNALNSAAPMNMPDFEDASPPHFRPDGSASSEPVGVFAALQNAKEIFEGRWTERAYEVTKKGKVRKYRINNPPSKWPTRLVRPPSLHVLYDHITVGDQPVPGAIPIIVLWVVNNYDALKKLGTGAYFYIPKIQTPQEALIFEKLLSRVEAMIGVPAGTFKIKMLYEEGNAGRFSAGDCLGIAPSPAGNQCRPLGLSGQPHRDVEGRSEGRFSRSAVHRHGDSEHDRLPTLQCADDAYGRHEERRAYQRLRRSAGWLRS